MKIPKPIWPIFLFAHRGASAFKTENTLPAFKKAIDMGAPGIELDVHLIGNTLMVFHEQEDVQRLCGKSINKTIYNYNPKELQKWWLQDGNKEGGYMPTLEQALNIIDRKAIINIELKGPGTGEYVVITIDKYVTKKGWKHTDFLVSSFIRDKNKIERDELIKVRELNKKIPVGVIVKKEKYKEGHFDWAMKLKACSIHIEKSGLITEDYVLEAKNKGLKVFVFTVNDSDMLKDFRDKNVDGIFTDDPGITTGKEK